MNDCFCVFIVNWDNGQAKNTFLSQLHQLIENQLGMLSRVIGEHAKKNIMYEESDERRRKFNSFVPLFLLCCNLEVKYAWGLFFLSLFLSLLYIYLFIYLFIYFV
jgi:hypothetical protein